MENYKTTPPRRVTATKTFLYNFYYENKITTDHLFIPIYISRSEVCYFRDKSSIMRDIEKVQVDTCRHTAKNEIQSRLGTKAS